MEESKVCECGRKLKHSWDEKCHLCSVIYCECGQDTGSKWNEYCPSCYRKKGIKENIQIVTGVLVGIILLSLIVATLIEFDSQITAFFSVIGNHMTIYYYSLSSFLQTFLMVLGSASLVVLGISALSFLLYSASTSSRY